MLRLEIMFQFHKGAIRTLSRRWLQPSPEFQFHKGAIRTCVSVSMSILVFSFNSIKVRLEHVRSKSVQIPKLFQFHKGAIRTKNIDNTEKTQIVSIP